MAELRLTLMLAAHIRRISQDLLTTGTCQTDTSNNSDFGSEDSTDSAYCQSGYNSTTSSCLQVRAFARGPHLIDLLPWAFVPQLGRGPLSSDLQLLAVERPVVWRRGKASAVEHAMCAVVRSNLCIV